VATNIKRETILSIDAFLDVCLYCLVMKYKYLLLFFVVFTITGCNVKDNSTNDLYPLDNQPTNAVELPNNSNKDMNKVSLLPAQDLLKIDSNQTVEAVIKTSLGDISVELYADKAPKTVANFVGLSEGTQPWLDPRNDKLNENTPLYQNIIFHRVIKDFMVQGGDPLGQGIGGPGYSFEDEFVGELKFDEPGILAMANSGPATNGSQFFITTVPTPWLNGKHTIFGKVTKGMDVLMNIQNVQTDTNDKPVDPVTIKSIEVIRK